MQLIVVGGQGYVGRAVVHAAVERDWRPQVCHARSQRDLEEALAQRPDDGDCALVNCVGYYGNDTGLLRASNIEFPSHLSDVARRASVRLLHISSSAVFDGVSTGRIVESDPPSPASAYGRSKLAGERAVLAAMPGASILRPAKVFGGADPRERLHTLARRVVAGASLPKPDRPQLWANFVWIEEVARVICDAAARAGQERFTHLASPRPWTEFIDLLGLVLGEAPQRFPRVVERCLGGAATLLRAVPAPLPRAAARILELWDRVEFADSRELIAPDSIEAGLRDVARRLQ